MILHSGACSNILSLFIQAFSSELNRRASLYDPTYPGHDTFILPRWKTHLGDMACLYGVNFIIHCKAQEIRAGVWTCIKHSRWHMQSTYFFVHYLLFIEIVEKCALSKVGLTSGEITCWVVYWQMKNGKEIFAYQGRHFFN